LIDHIPNFILDASFLFRNWRSGGVLTGFVIIVFSPEGEIIGFSRVVLRIETPPSPKRRQTGAQEGDCSAQFRCWWCGGCCWLDVFLFFSQSSVLSE